MDKSYVVQENYPTYPYPVQFLDYYLVKIYLLTVNDCNQYGSVNDFSLWFRETRYISSLQLFGVYEFSDPNRIATVIPHSQQILGIIP